MAKVICIKSKLEIVELEPKQVSLQEVADQLYTLEENLKALGLQSAAASVKHAYGKVMPKVVEEKRVSKY